MLKKILLVTSLSLILVGCGSNTATTKAVSSSKTVDQVVQEQVQATENSSSQI